jgi:hypothetical protein
MITVVHRFEPNRVMARALITIVYLTGALAYLPSLTESSQRPPPRLPYERADWEKDRTARAGQKQILFVLMNRQRYGRFTRGLGTKSSNIIRPNGPDTIEKFRFGVACSATLSISIRKTFLLLLTPESHCECTRATNMEVLNAP